MASDAKLWCFLLSAPEQTAEQTLGKPVIWDAIALIMTSLAVMIIPNPIPADQSWRILSYKPNHNKIQPSVNKHAWCLVYTDSGTYKTLQLHGYLSQCQDNMVAMLLLMKFRNYPLWNRSHVYGVRLILSTDQSMTSEKKAQEMYVGFFM